MRKHLLIIAFVMLFGLITANFSMAQATVTDNLEVTASVGESCKISSVDDIGFGVYDPFDLNPNDADGKINFQCVKGTSYEVYITGDRWMNGTGSSTDLLFQLYTDAARGSVFPNASTGSPTITNDATGTLLTVDVYGRINPGRMVEPAADYSATLIATIEY